MPIDFLLLFCTLLRLLMTFAASPTNPHFTIVYLKKIAILGRLDLLVYLTTF